MAVKTPEFETKKVTLSSVKDDLSRGMTKWKKDDIGFGSIEKKHNLLPEELIQLLGHPKVKLMETRIPTFVILDDLEEEEAFQPVPEVASIAEVKVVETKPMKTYSQPAVIEVKTEEAVEIIESTFI